MKQRQGQPPKCETTGEYLPRHPPLLEHTLQEVARRRGLTGIPNVQCRSDTPVDAFGFDPDEALSILQEVEVHYNDALKKQRKLDSLIRARHQEYVKRNDRAKSVVLNSSFIGRGVGIETRAAGILRAGRKPRHRILTQRAILTHSAYMSVLSKCHKVNCQKWYTRVERPMKIKDQFEERYRSRREALGRTVRTGFGSEKQIGETAPRFFDGTYGPLIQGKY